MSVSELLNGVVLYIAVIIGLTIVFALATVFFVKSWRRAIELGIETAKLKKILKSSIIFTIIPSLAIVIALFSLASVLGVPLSWFRLCVVGSLLDELFSDKTCVSGAGVD